MVRILFLDDDKNRFLEFSETLMALKKRGEVGNFDLKWALNAQMARSFLENMLTFDVAFLDHDLAPEHYTHAPGTLAPPDGRAVAHFIAAMPKADQPGFIHIHSWNYSGAKEMEAILQEAGIHTTQAMFPRGIPDVLAAVAAILQGEKVK